MKKIFFLPFFFPLFIFSQNVETEWSDEFILKVKLEENDFGSLKNPMLFGEEISISPHDMGTYGDTLKDGTYYNWYYFGKVWGEFVAVYFPDGVAMIIECPGYVQYPTGAAPGMYNGVDEYVRILEEKEDRFICYFEPIVRSNYDYSNEPKEEPKHPYFDDPYIPDVVKERLLPIASWTDEERPIGCRYKEFPLNAEVRFVDSYGDIKVKIVDDNEYLTVRFVGTSTSSGYCGQWKAVESREDFTVELVDYGEDFTIRIEKGW